MKLQTDIVEQKEIRIRKCTVPKSQAMQAINPSFSHNSVYSMPCDETYLYGNLLLFQDTERQH